FFGINPHYRRQWYPNLLRDTAEARTKMNIIIFHAHITGRAASNVEHDTSVLDMLFRDLYIVSSSIYHQVWGERIVLYPLIWRAHHIGTCWCNRGGFFAHLLVALCIIIKYCLVCHTVVVIEKSFTISLFYI